MYMRNKGIFIEFIWWFMGFTALLEKIFFQIGQICIANTIIGLTVQTLHETGLHVNKRNYLFSQKKKKKRKTCTVSS